MIDSCTLMPRPIPPRQSTPARTPPETPGGESCGDERQRNEKGNTESIEPPAEDQRACSRSHPSQYATGTISFGTVDARAKWKAMTGKSANPAATKAGPARYIQKTFGIPSLFMFPVLTSRIVRLWIEVMRDWQQAQANCHRHQQSSKG